LIHAGINRKRNELISALSKIAPGAQVVLRFEPEDTV